MGGIRSEEKFRYAFATHDVESKASAASAEYRRSIGDVKEAELDSGSLGVALLRAPLSLLASALLGLWYSQR